MLKGMLKFAVRNLLSRPMRSLLSLLGLTVAIMGMVGLFSVAEGLDRMVADTFGRIPGLLAMQPGAPIPLFSRMPAAWRSELAAVEGVDVVNAEIWQRVNVIESKMIVSPPRFLFGTDISSRLDLKHGVYREEMVDGRFLSDGRNRTTDDRGTLNVVISRQIADEFNRSVGQTLRVNGHDLHIVGIYHCGSLLLDVALILDIEQVRRISRFDNGSVSCFYIEQTAGTDVEQLAERIRDAFRDQPIERWQPSAGLAFGGGDGGGNPLQGMFSWLDRQLKSMGAPPGKPPPSPPGRPAANGPGNLPGDDPAGGGLLDVDETLPIEIRSAVEWASRFDKFTADLDLFLLIITSIGVTVAVLSIVNTMLMSVSERIIEFGILKANGWSKVDVLKLIFFESAVLGFGGGMLGSVLGLLTTWVINATWPTRVELFASPLLLGVSVVFSTVLGVLGGLYPAVWAMRMMPMDAIRRG